MAFLSMPFRRTPREKAGHAERGVLYGKAFGGEHGFSAGLSAVSTMSVPEQKSSAPEAVSAVRQRDAGAV
jgi:hypothetical protein